MYKNLPKPKHCPFCIGLNGREVVENLKYSLVLKNNYPYDTWEYCKVVDHLMVVPKQHVSKLAELNEAQKLEIIQVISRYESDGFDIYARGTSSAIKSVPAHQHTHLIKTQGKPHRASLYLKKPYILLDF